MGDAPRGGGGTTKKGVGRKTTSLWRRRILRERQHCGIEHPESAAVSALTRSTRRTSHAVAAHRTRAGLSSPLARHRSPPPPPPLLPPLQPITTFTGPARVDRRRALSAIARTAAAARFFATFCRARSRFPVKNRRTHRLPRLTGKRYRNSSTTPAVARLPFPNNRTAVWS